MKRLQQQAIEAGLANLAGWDCVDEHNLVKGYKFADYAGALAFVNEVGRAAEAQNHHPEITFGWGYVEIQVYTHSAGGITRKDFALAAAREAAYAGSPSSGSQGSGCGT